MNEKNKKLAEWFGFKVAGNFLKNKAGQLIAEVGRKKDDEEIDLVFRLPDWEPHKDWNQLKMLEEKMIKEGGFRFKAVQYFGLTFENKDKCRVKYIVKLETELTGKGKNELEATYDAIIQYVEGLK